MFLFTDRERVRYEATVRLANSNSSQYPSERRRPNENLATTLEKNVSESNFLVPM